MQSKICKDCGLDLPLSNYYYVTSSKQKGWYMTQCKDCRRLMKQNLYKTDRETVLARGKRWKDNNRDKLTIYNSKYWHNTRKSDPKYYTRHKAYYLYQSGKITKPECCEDCKEITTKLQMHHYKGYDLKNVADVQWLCRLCHEKV